MFRKTMIDDKYPVPQSEHGFGVWKRLKNVFRGKSLRDSNEPEEAAMEDPERCANYPGPCCLPY